MNQCPSSPPCIGLALSCAHWASGEPIGVVSGVACDVVDFADGLHGSSFTGPLADAAGFATGLVGLADVLAFFLCDVCVVAAGGLGVAGCVVCELVLLVAGVPGSSGAGGVLVCAAAAKDNVATASAITTTIIALRITNSVWRAAPKGTNAPDGEWWHHKLGQTNLTACISWVWPRLLPGSSAFAFLRCRPP